VWTGVEPPWAIGFSARWGVQGKGGGGVDGVVSKVSSASAKRAWRTMSLLKGFVLRLEKILEIGAALFHSWAEE
jgi:hypothetical protein